MRIFRFKLVQLLLNAHIFASCWASDLISFHLPPNSLHLNCASAKQKGLCSFLQSQSFLPTAPSLIFSEEVIVEATIINIHRCRWHDLEQLSPAITDTVVCRVILQYRQSPQQALYFFQWSEQNRKQRKLSPLCLDSNCVLIHVLIAAKMFDESLNLMTKLMQQGGIAPLNLLDSLGYDYINTWCKFAAYDALVRACTQLKAIKNAHLVINTLRGNSDCWRHFQFFLE